MKTRRPLSPLTALRWCQICAKSVRGRRVGISNTEIASAGACRAFRTGDQAVKPCRHRGYISSSVSFDCIRANHRVANGGDVRFHCAFRPGCVHRQHRGEVLAMLFRDQQRVTSDHQIPTHRRVARHVGLRYRMARRPSVRCQRAHAGGSSRCVVTGTAHRPIDFTPVNSARRYWPIGLIRCCAAFRSRPPRPKDLRRGKEPHFAGVTSASFWTHHPRMNDCVCEALDQFARSYDGVISAWTAAGLVARVGQTDCN